MNGYRWLNEVSQYFLDKDYLEKGMTVDERVNVMFNTAEKLLGIPGFASRIKANFQKGWYSISSPIWSNFGNERGLPISCFGSYIDDTMVSILDTVAEVGMMTKIGGGTSATFSSLRERGALIKGNGKSSGSVHFMQLYNALIGIISQGSCYIEGTEVLTNNGFKDFRDIDKNDKLAELDEYNNISFTSNYELVVNDFKGELECFKGIKRDDSVSLKVTPNHRMIVQRLKRKKRKKYWPEYTEITEAKDINLHRDNRLILSGMTKNGEGLSLEDRLRVAYQADGIKDGGHRKIRFRFRKKRKIQRLTWLLKELNIKYEISNYSNGDVHIYFDYLEHIKKETFREWINLEDISNKWCSEFIEELKNWDGCLQNNTVVYTSCEKDNVDFVQAVSVLCKKRTRLSNRSAKDNRKTLYRIQISDNNHKQGDAVAKYQEYYEGKVYCAIVPKGRLLVRYEGRTLLCGNTRRGSFAGYLRIDHPDIMEFLAIKSEGAPIQDISFGVVVPDYWMEEMIGDGTPEGGDKSKRKIWAKVIESRYNIGFPYILFVDNANKYAADVYRDKLMLIHHTNLCTEIMLPNCIDESFVCDLSSMNIKYYEEWKDTDAVELLTFLLDAVMTEFINKAREIPHMHRAVKFAERHRALGIGWLGWHSYLQSKMIAFESMEAKFENTKVARTIYNQAYAASRKLAEQFGEPEVLKGYGRRNTTLIAIAPTKSSAFILGQVSEGIEPHQSNYYIKDLAKGKFTVKNQELENLLKNKKLDTPEVWNSILKMGGSVQHLDCLTDHEKSVFKTFGEISQKEVIIQATQRQKFIDQGQSINLMIHPSIKAKDTNALIIEFWRMGGKSLYYQKSVNAAQAFSRDILNCVSCEG